MATKQDLDNAIAKVKADVAAAAQRVSDAINALTDKLTTGGDFTKEVADLQSADDALQTVAAPPAPAPQPAPPPTP